MAKLKTEDLRNLGLDELKDKLDQLKKELMNLRFQTKTGKLERVQDKSETRRNIARVKTIMSEKNLENKS